MPEQAPPQKTGALQHTKQAGKVIGKAGSSLRGAVNSLDNISISRHGLSTKKQLSAGNVGYDRENYVAAPRRDASHFAPPPKRAANVVPPSTAETTVVTPAVAPTTTRPGPPLPAAKPGTIGRAVPIPPARAGPTSATPATGRPVPPPPPARKGISAPGEEPLPVYTPVPGSVAQVAPSSMMNDLSSRLGGMTTSSAPQAAASPQPHGRIPSKAEATSAFKSAGTVSSLYGKYGASSSTGAKTSQPTPSWQDVKAGAAAAKDLHGFAGKYAPKTTPEQREKALGFGNRVLASQGHATVPAGAMQAMSKASSTPAQSTGVLSSAAPPIPAGKPTLPVRAPAAKPTCTALFSFEAQQPDDLPFQKGDVIEVLDRTDDPEAWWRGSCRGRTGLFPANYCRMNS